MKLPDKLSDLIELALSDMEKCESDSNYEVDMDQWVLPIKGKCRVCLAGSVLVQTMGLSRTEQHLPNYMDRDTHDKCYILDNVRRSWWPDALKPMFPPDSLSYIGFLCAKLPNVPPYRHNPNGFKTALRKAITVLKEHDL